MNESIKLKKATYHLYTFLISKMISSLGANVYSFGMSMFILSITGSAFSFAANLIFSILPRTILSPIAGIIVDRFSRKAIVLTGQAGTALIITGLLVYSLIFGLSIPAIYVTTVFYSICSTFTGIAFTASVANLVDEDRIQKAMSFNQLSLSIAGIGGPIVGGMLFGFLSIELFLVINIVAYVIAFLLESTMNFRLYSKEQGQEQKQESMISSFKEGFAYLKTKQVISSLLWVLLLLNMFFTSVNVGIQFILVEKLKMEYTLIGFVEAGAAIGMLVFSIYFAARSNVKFPLLFSKRSILGMSALVSVIAIPLVVSFSSGVNFVYFFMVMFLFGSLGVLTNTPIGVLLQKEVDENYRGRIFGILEMMAMGMMPLGTLIFGVLYDLVPAQYILIVSSITLIMIVLVFLRRSVLEMAHPELKEKRIGNLETAEIIK
ncbi:MFS transporter [Ureibacillus manganicus]|uniref:Permease n=1 Tax=Ureibacillus manganicus DSM 26584 TaxID=1384049 RepID=A0A0A3I1Y1_9BACL|nr:MFS transporter [Ureibacillus manganicus]KGR78796.1 permease [Ureibacillus manganicus DSM 26584]